METEYVLAIVVFAAVILFFISRHRNAERRRKSSSTGTPVGHIHPPPRDTDLP